MNTKVLPNRRAVGRAQPLRIVSRRAKSYASIAPYLIALSQTDTVEQERWMAALAADRRSSNDVRVRLASPKKRQKV